LGCGPRRRAGPWPSTAAAAALGHETDERDFGRGNRALYLTDPDGNVLELTERTTLWDGSPATDSDGA
jgi:hypothetical protein